MTDLSEWGVEPSENPPRIQKQRQIHHTVGERRAQVGYIGPCPERAVRAFVSKRYPEAHKVHALDAYAISEGVLQQLGSMGVGRVFIHETPDDDVLEWPMRKWKEAPDLPSKYMMREDDPQRFLKAETATRWEGHGANLYIPRDVTLDVDLE